MLIAVAYKDGEIYEHFGHCPMFALYEYGEYVSDCTKRLIDTSGLSGHHQMAEKMKELQQLVLEEDMSILKTLEFKVKRKKSTVPKKKVEEVKDQETQEDGADTQE